MKKADLYDIGGIKKGTVALPNIFSGKINLSLLAQALRVYEDRSHPGLHKVKTRARVNISKAKIYRQKGTGRARHGAKSAPIFVGGGVAHGPKGVKRILTLSKKQVKEALVSALAIKIKNGEILAVEGLQKISKTKQAGDFIKAISKNFKGNLKKYTVVFSDENVKIKKFIDNLPMVKCIRFTDLNAYLVQKGGYMMFDNRLFVKAKTKKQSVSKSKVVKKIK